MKQFKCAFSSTLIGAQFGCDKSVQVTRRTGPDVACSSEASHHRCAALFGHMKQAALPAFGVEDDLLSMPHSVLVKVQFGGLLGLQKLVNESPAVTTKVDDIDILVAAAIENYGSPDTIPCHAIVEEMKSYQLRRRSR